MAEPDTVTTSGTGPAPPDPMDPRHHRDGPPHELFARLRRECPVRPGTGPDGGRFWSLTRDAEVAAAGRDPETFSSARGGVFLHPDQIAPLELFRHMLLFKDPPEHRDYRKVLASVFTPRAVAALEDGIRARATAVIDGIVEAGTADLVEDVAVPLPLAVLVDLMGLPAGDVGRLREWTAQIEQAQQSAEPAAATGTFDEMVGYLQEQVGRQVAEGRDGLVTRLRTAEVDGTGLTDEEILTFFGLLMFAGNDTTRNTAATGTLALLESGQWRELTADPGRIPDAVEEVLRHTSVVKYFARTATRDVELAGQRIAAGDKVVLWFGSASRDEAAVDDPDRFDIHRGRPPHRAFGGGGPHMCLGHQLARLELRVLFEELTRRLPDLALAGEPRYLVSTWTHGLTAMPVRFTPGAREG